MKKAFFFVFLLITGCDVGPSPKFAREMNDDRTKRLLPVIADNWSNYNKGNNSTEAAWSSGYDLSSGKPGHSGKKVLYPNGSIETEEDYYYSGQTFDGSSIDPDSGTSWEMLTVRYSFMHPDSPWTCYHIRVGGMDELSLSAAEDLLKTWGLQRLNYNK